MAYANNIPQTPARSDVGAQDAHRRRMLAIATRNNLQSKADLLAFLQNDLKTVGDPVAQEAWAKVLQDEVPRLRE